MNLFLSLPERKRAHERLTYTSLRPLELESKLENSLGNAASCIMLFNIAVVHKMKVVDVNKDKVS